jgi:hypothetical protein
MEMVRSNFDSSTGLLARRMPVSIPQMIQALGENSEKRVVSLLTSPMMVTYLGQYGNWYTSHVAYMAGHLGFEFAHPDERSRWSWSGRG